MVLLDGSAKWVVQESVGRGVAWYMGVPVGRGFFKNSGRGLVPFRRQFENEKEVALSQKS